MVRIWFNHWFSAVYNIISMMREGCKEEIYVIGTNKNDTAVYKSVCDEWYVEPDGVSEDEYVSFCLDFCKNHKIDVFVPRRELTPIIRNSERFAEIGVKLFTDVKSDMIAILDDKIAAYEFFAGKGFECIPDIRIAKNIDEFISAYEALKVNNKRVCYKLSIDEGARSFRVIDARLKEERALLEKPGFKIDYPDALAVLSKYDFSIPVLVMPYLDGYEISIDCMKTAKGDLIIPRYKNIGRYSIVRFEESVLSLSSRLMNEIGANMPINIQLRMHEDKLWLLEINPRMSGGMQLSCAAAGINLPAIALNQLLGYETEWQYPSFEKRRVAHVETAICFD
ncbi:MAG: ATP-grasp domain-containing protein [Clostridia bacterium]|nr:ATP-grasp domain-containing protein [Clostridia bacterium]